MLFYIEKYLSRQSDGHTYAKRYRVAQATFVFSIINSVSKQVSICFVFSSLVGIFHLHKFIFFRLKIDYTKLLYFIILNRWNDSQIYYKYQHIGIEIEEILHWNMNKDVLSVFYRIHPGNIRISPVCCHFDQVLCTWNVSLWLVFELVNLFLIVFRIEWTNL